MRNKINGFIDEYLEYLELVPSYENVSQGSHKLLLFH